VALEAPINSKNTVGFPKCMEKPKKRHLYSLNFLGFTRLHYPTRQYLPVHKRTSLERSYIIETVLHIHIS
jgi:hypothetical protein